MSQPVKLSDELVLDARLVAAATERSIAGQIEFWAKLGRVLESQLSGDRLLALCNAAERHKLSDRLIPRDEQEWQNSFSQYLETRPFPHYEPAPDAAGAASAPGIWVKIEADGTRTIGRFVGREFRALE